MNRPEVEKFKMLLKTFFQREVFRVSPALIFFPMGGPHAGAIGAPAAGLPSHGVVGVRCCTTR